MRNPLVTAVGASVGTFVVLGAGTMVVSGAALTVAKRVVRQRKVGCALSQALSYWLYFGIEAAVTAQIGL